MRLGTRNLGSALSVLPLILFSSFFAPFGTISYGYINAPLTASAPFDYIVIIIMENQGIDSILGSSSAPYLNRLGHMYSLAKHYSAISHPSLPNYLALVAGSTFDCGGYDGNPNSNSCTSSAWESPNLVDRLETKGLTWKAYMEAMPSNCYESDSESYVVRHDPFVYFSDIANNQDRCNRVVPAGTGDSALLKDLASDSTSSNLMWLTPDSCNDMHDCPVSTGDAYLSNLVPKILASNLFTTQKAVLFLTFDEGDSPAPIDYVYTVWAGPAAKANYTSSNPYTHYSLLKTLARVWGLPALTSLDSGAPAMAEFLRSRLPQAAPQPTTNLAPIALLATGVAIAFGIVIFAVWHGKRIVRRRVAQPPC